MQIRLSTHRYLSDAAQDIRLALRRLRRTPTLGVAVVLTLGLGLGAASAVLTMSQAALIDPLPFAQSHRLVHLWEIRKGTNDRSGTSFATLQDWRARASSFSGLEGYNGSNVTVGVGDDVRMLRGAEITAGFFGLLGVPLATGRDFIDGEDAPPGARVVIVSDGFAQSVTGGQALNQTITINGTPHVIVGVLPRAFQFAILQDADIWVPLTFAQAIRADRSQRILGAIGRVRDGVSLKAAHAQLLTVMDGLARDNPETLAGRTIDLSPIRDAILGNVKPILVSLLVAVALLLAAMSANLALLMLTRFVERSSELAMRTALGATRPRMLRQLLAESVALSLAGAALAIGVGGLATRTLIAGIPGSVMINMPYLAGAAPDARVALVIAAVAVALSLVFGLWPALLVTGKGWQSGALRSTPTRGNRRIRHALVAAQIALTVVLLVSSGLLVASFNNLTRRDLGLIAPEELVTARVPLSGARYQPAIAQQQFYEKLLEDASALPGVRSVGLISQVPGGGSRTTTADTTDRPLTLSARPQVALRVVAGHYFSTMGIPVLEGRDLASRDRADAPPACVVSARFARWLATDGAAIGRRLRLGSSPGAEWEVVGVVGDVQVASIDVDSPPAVYLSHLQAAENRMTLVFRTRAGVEAIARQVREIVKRLDPAIPVYGLGTLQQAFAESRAMFSRRLPMLICGVFALAALALSLVALYAMCDYEVFTRRREFGIRLALGGSPAALRRTILGDGLALASAGVAIGVAAAVIVSRSMNAILFGIASTDWRIYLVVAGLVLLSALFTTLRPAFGATSVDPAVVMREP